MHTGTIITDKNVDTAVLYNINGSPVTGSSVTISSAGMNGALKQLQWDGVADGSYYLSLLVGGAEVHFGIKTKFTGTSWVVVNEILEEGGDGPWGETTINQIDTNSPPETILDTMELIGPKAVKTQELEITAHGLNGVAELHRQLRPDVPMGLFAIQSTIAKPKGECDC